MTRTPVVFTADDFGLTEGTSTAILEAHDRGLVTATSVLAVASGVGRSLQRLDDHPDLSTGVHLALVGEDPPLLSAAEIPTLVDRRGRLRGSWRQLIPLLALGRIDPAEVHREFAAQIELVRAARPVSHLDTHQHLHLWPSVASVVIDLARTGGIGAVRVPRATSRRGRGRVIDRLADRLAEQATTAGLSVTARFRGIDEAGHWTSDTLVSALEDLANGEGSVEINLHPGAAHDPDRSRFDWGYDWFGELMAACDRDVADAVDRLGFVEVGR